MPDTSILPSARRRTLQASTRQRPTRKFILAFFSCLGCSTRDALGRCSGEAGRLTPRTNLLLVGFSPSSQPLHSFSRHPMEPTRSSNIRLLFLAGGELRMGRALAPIFDMKLDAKLLCMLNSVSHRALQMQADQPLCLLPPASRPWVASPSSFRALLPSGKNISREGGDIFVEFDDWPGTGMICRGKGCREGRQAPK